MGADSLAENTPDASICLPKPKNSLFQRKKTSLGLRSPCPTSNIAVLFQLLNKKNRKQKVLLHAWRNTSRRSMAGPIAGTILLTVHDQTSWFSSVIVCIIFVCIQSMVPYWTARRAGFRRSSSKKVHWLLLLINQMATSMLLVSKC